MGTVREKPEMELDQGSVEQIRKLFNDYVVDPLGKELKEAESQIKWLCWKELRRWSSSCSQRWVTAAPR